jgi:hypothetical protein
MPSGYIQKNHNLFLICITPTFDKIKLKFFLQNDSKKKKKTFFQNKIRYKVKFNRIDETRAL